MAAEREAEILHMKGESDNGITKAGRSSSRLQTYS